MGLFTGVEDAQENKGFRYIEPGNYTLKVIKCTAGRSRKGEDFFAVDFEILESTNSDFLQASECSWMVMKRHDAFLGNIKGFIAEVMDVDGSEISERDCEAVVGDKQPLAGKEVFAIAYNKTTKAGKPFTVVHWGVEGEKE